MSLSNPSSIPVAKSEEFFRLCNAHNARVPYLRSARRIVEAMGVLGVAAGKVEEIINQIEAMVLRDGMPNFRTKEGMDWRQTAIVEVSTLYPEVFDMNCDGVEEEKFVRSMAIYRMIWCVTEKGRKGARNTRRRDARNAREEAADDNDEEAEVVDDGTRADNDGEAEVANDGAQSDNDREMEVVDDGNLPANDDEAGSLSPVATTPPSISIEVWSTQLARSLGQFELKVVLLPTSGVPSYEALNEVVLPLLPTNANPPYIIDGRLEFVHVLHDGTNTGIISQDVLKMEWDDWRKASPNGKSFHLWVRDCMTEDAHKKAQPPMKFGAWGWEYHPLANGPIRFVRLPLRS